MKKILLALLLVFCIQELKAQNLKKEWMKVLQACNAGQTFGNETVFFGPSNSIGIGSVWRKTDSKGYNPRFELSDIVIDSTVRKSIIKRGVTTSQCAPNKNNAWESSISVPVLGPIFNLTGLDLLLHKARKTTISVENLAVDMVKEVPFEQAIAALAKKDPQNPYILDIFNNPGRLVVTKAYRLTGMSIKLDYDPKDLDSLKTKYPTGGSITLGGDKGIKVEFSYKSTTDVTIKLPAEVYIAGEFSRLINGTINLNSGSKPSVQLIKVKLDPQASIGKIEPVELTRK